MRDCKSATILSEVNFHKYSFFDLTKGPKIGYQNKQGNKTGVKLGNNQVEQERLKISQKDTWIPDNATFLIKRVVNLDFR